MQDIREIELRDSGSNANNNISRFEPLLYVPAFTQKDFHYVYLDLPQRDLHQGITTLQLEYTTLNHNHLYTRGICTKPKFKHNHLYTRGIGTRPKLNDNHVYTRGIGAKPKQKRDYNLGDHNRPQTILGDHNRPQILT